MVKEVHKTIGMALPQAPFGSHHDVRAKHLMQRVKTKGLREPLEAVQTILIQNRCVARVPPLARLGRRPTPHPRPLVLPASLSFSLRPSPKNRKAFFSCFSFFPPLNSG